MLPAFLAKRLQVLKGSLYLSNKNNEFEKTHFLVSDKY